MENQTQQGSNEKRILLIGGVIFVVLGACALVGSIFLRTSNVQKVETPQEVKNDAARIQEILGVLNTPPVGQVISFGDLKPGKNEIGGAVFELFPIKAMKKGESKTTYVEEMDDNNPSDYLCSSGCTTKTDYYFSYNGRDLKLSEDNWTSGGTAGGTISYSVSVLNQENKHWDVLGGIMGNEGLYIIGYKDNLILSGSSSRYHEPSDQNTIILNLVQKKATLDKTVGGGGFFLGGDIAEGRTNVFYVKNQSLYLLAPKNQCYFLWKSPTYICGDSCDIPENFCGDNCRDYSYQFDIRKSPGGIFAGCVAGYYPIETTATSTQQIEPFADEYAKQAAKYDYILQTKTWDKSLDVATSSSNLPLPSDVKQLYQGSGWPENNGIFLSDFRYTASSTPRGANIHPVEWLSPLLGRTLNMALAGQSDEAWKMFQEDYVSLSKQYPLADPVDPIQVEHDLRAMTDKSSEQE